MSPLRGRRDVIDRLEQQSRQCPDQTFALVGYSQGAGVMHAAIERLDEDIFPKIKALVMFGDPDFGDGEFAFPEELRDKVFQNCADGDPVSSNPSSQWRDRAAKQACSLRLCLGQKI